MSIGRVIKQISGLVSAFWPLPVVHGWEQGERGLLGNDRARVGDSAALSRASEQIRPNGRDGLRSASRHTQEELEMSRSTGKQTLLAQVLTVLSTVGAALCGSAQAQVTGCIVRPDLVPAALVHVYTTETINSGGLLITVNHDYETDELGCVTVPGQDTATVTMRAHNPTVRMRGPFSHQQVVLRDGQTTMALLSFTHLRIAENMRIAYNEGLREFEPWGDAEYPLGSTDLFSDQWIDVAYPTPQSPIGRLVPFTEPCRPDGCQPTIHLFAGWDDANTSAHELGHALHFIALEPLDRLELETKYVAWLAVNIRDPFHWFTKATSPMVAWVEAFAIFAEVYPTTSTAAGITGPARHALYFNQAEDRFAADLQELRAGEIVQEPGAPPLGAAELRTLRANAISLEDVEGAVFAAVFLDFARAPGIGLDFVVRTAVDCRALDIQEYGTCLRNTFGRHSAEFGTLRRAALTYNIVFDSAPALGSSTHCSEGFPCVHGEGDCDNHNECTEETRCAFEVGSTFGWPSWVDVCMVPPLFHWAHCSPSYPCIIGEGDCDSDADCVGTAICAVDVGASYGQNPVMDFCEPAPNGHAEHCGPSFLGCAEGHGHCDSDDECLAGLECHAGVGPQWGLGSGVSVCESDTLGSFSYCENRPVPCQVGGGNCDPGMNQCASGLVCATDTGPAWGYAAGVDVCEYPPVTFQWRRFP